MGVNTRLVAAAGVMAAVQPPGTALGAPNVQAAVLSDGSGNLVKALDNGDGTATVAVDELHHRLLGHLDKPGRGRERDGHGHRSGRWHPCRTSSSRPSPPAGS